MTKSRRARKKNRRRATSARSGTSRPTVVLVRDETPVGPTAEEYRYVIQDLKRVAVLAAAMFAMLVILSFFIH